ncbi:MAG: nuclear transport factor 2 family protein [Anaerolineales bacterium]|nr:nuclear transport factor 2 family protein [Anaerolineales bacterium]
MDTEVHEFLLRHLQGIMENSIDSYHETTAEDLTLYEWWVTPQRLDGLPFHEFMMNANAARGSVFGAEDKGQKAQSRFDLANLHIQRYGDTAIASYTMLISTALPEGVKVASHNESRVIVKLDGAWKVVHVHKSPAYAAPHVG